MQYLNFTFIFVILFSSCDRVMNIDYSSIKKETLSLKTKKEHQDYLEKIFRDDQSVRTELGSEILLKYGQNSKEYKDYVNQQCKLDDLNLAKIETYFTTFGHPKKSDVGEIASLTPWVVIHHSNTYEDRVNSFPFLHKAYLSKDIDDSKFASYLNRMYEIKFGTRLKITSPYKTSYEIDTLIKSMNLRKLLM